MYLSKKIVLMVLFFVTVLGLLLVGFCVAPVTVPAKPKAGPEIVSIEIHNDPIWKPPITVTDSYTGKVTFSEPGYWAKNGSIDITIKNSPFTPYTDRNGNTIKTYYCIFYKNHFGVWLGDTYYSIEPITKYQSDSTYTVITFRYGENTILGGSSDLSFRIQTVEEGYFIQNNWDVIGHSVFEGVGSMWTEFTITLPAHDRYSDNNPSGTFKPNIKTTSIAPSTSDPNNLPTLDPVNHPSQNPWLTYLLIIIAVVCIVTIPLVIIAYQYGQRKNKFLNDNAVRFVGEVKI
jgi:hypothetical protein